MNSLLSRALELQRMAHELMYLDTNGSPIYSDEFCRLNKEVLTRSDSLFSEQSSDIEESQQAWPISLQDFIFQLPG